MDGAKGVGWLQLGAVIAVALVAGVRAEAQWQIQPIAAVQPAGPGVNGPFYAPPALTFDSQGRPHVAYQGAPSGAVLHTHGMGSGAVAAWTAPVTVSTYSDGTPAVVHLASAGDSVSLGVCTAYAGNGVERAVFQDGSWQFYAQTYAPGLLCGMVVDDAGRVNWMLGPAPLPTIGLNFGYQLLRQTSTTAAETVTVVPGIASIASPLGSRAEDFLRLDGDVVRDSSGDLHTVQLYNIGGSGYLFYAKGPASGPFEVQDNLHMGWWMKTGRSSIAVDAAGRPHIAYTVLWPDYGVVYLTHDANGAWQSEKIEYGGRRSGLVGTFPEVLVDGQGAVHVIYAKGFSGQLVHAKRVNNQWQFEVIDTIGTQASYGLQVGALAAEIDAQGGIGVVYWDADDGMLEYAYLAGQP